MADVKSMIFDIIAKDRASGTFDKVGKTAESSHSKVSHWGIAGAVAFAAVGGAALEFGKKAIGAYSDAAKGALALSRVTGMTITQSSRLRFAAEESGIGMDSLQRSMQKLAKAEGTGATQIAAYEAKLQVAQATHKKFTGHLGTMATAFQSLGIKIQGTNGHILPMNTLMNKLADRFKTMPDGPQKTALAMQLFGKSGADMIKVLNKGSSGLKELAAQSDKTGNTIRNTDALKKQIMAQREFHAAIQGLMITVGSLLMPILTTLSVFLVQHVAPAFTAVATWVKQNQQVIHDLTPFIVGIVAALTGLKILSMVTKAWAALNVVMAANPIGIVVVAIAALALGLIYAYKHSEEFRKIVNGAFNAVKNAAVTAFNWVKNTAVSVFNWLKNNWKLLLAILTGPFGLAVYFISRYWTNIKDGATSAMRWVSGKFDALVGFVTGLPARIGKAASGLFDGIKGAFRGAIDWIIQAWNNLSFTFPGINIPGVLSVGSFTLNTPNIPLLARGGIVPATPGGRLVRVAEAGHDEAIVPLSRGGRAGALGGGDTHYHITINGALDPVAVGKQVQTVLLKLKRTQGGAALGIA